MTQSKKQNKSLETDHKERQITELPDKVFEITLSNMFNELKENTEILNQENDAWKKWEYNKELETEK